MGTSTFKQFHVNIVREATPNVKVTQLSLELLRQSNPEVRVDQVVVEVLRDNTIPRKKIQVMFV